MSKKISVYDKMKMEIAHEMGITLGSKATAYENGQVGGEITKRLVAWAREQLVDIDGDLSSQLK